MITLLIADDHQMFIDGIKALLKNEKEIKVIGEALNGVQLLKLLEKEKPHVVLMDINMPEMDGVEATKTITSKYPKVKIIMLSMHSTKEFVAGLIEAGASGYILKNTGKRELLEAIQAVSEGKSYYSKEVTEIIMDSFKNPLRKLQNPELPQLTDREKEVLKLIAQEFSTKEIAEKLFISTNTVETHRKNIMSKISAKNMAGLVKYAMQTGLLE
jgi:DNA-binding NarL/FixJ family response regulator